MTVITPAFAKSPPIAMNESRPAPSLITERVTKTFRQGGAEVHALHGCSLAIERGEFVAIMGASGSGKSTFLHLAGGLTKPDSGRVLVGDHDLSDLTDYELTTFRRRRIGLVFQAFNLIPSLTVEENILLPIHAAHDVGIPPGRLDALIADLKLEECRGRYPDTLSGGQQQRVAIARALVTDPELVLADEPTGSLDSVTGQHLCRLLRDQNEQHQRTVVLVTHEPAVAVWAHRVIVLKDGQVIADFSTAEFSDPLTLASHYQKAINVAASFGEAP